MKSKKVILLIIDGWGWGEKNISNPFRLAKTPILDYFKKNYPFCLLSASGYSVGLSSNEPASCEIGHMTIGIGRAFFTILTKINLSIENGDFFKNEVLVQAIRHCQKYKSRLHLVGLLSKQNQIADSSHLIALLELAKNLNFNNVYIHLFTDGIDSPPKSALDLIENLENIKKSKDLPGKIATLCGRFYALDKTGDYFLKTQQAFLLLIEGKGKLVSDIKEVFKEKYASPNFNDSILEPTIIDPEAKIKDNDAIIFFHHETKNIFQLANSFLDPDFKEFPRPQRKNIYFAAFAKYLPGVDHPVAFIEEEIETSLSKVIAENNLKQFKLIDENRKDLLTFYFNGLIQEEHSGEIIKILPPFANDRENLDERTKEFFNYLKMVVQEKDFDFVAGSLPTLDIVGHLGDMSLGIYFIETLDRFLKEFYQISLENNYALILTSDHGNIEKMIELKKGQKETLHDPSPVPFFLIDKAYQKTKSQEEIYFFERKTMGSLSDIAPTILDLMAIKIPKSFTGKSLLKYFKR
jgi:2,3-bisphosphoglycerate-independent phosphoglycerate mutase